MTLKNGRSGRGALALVLALVVLLVGAGALYARLTAQAGEGLFAPAAETAAPAETKEPEKTEASAVTAAPSAAAQATASPGKEAQREVAGPMPRADLAPAFTVYDDAGEAVSLASLRGKPAVINFFASWCAPCQSEMPHFDAAYAAYGDRIHFMMVDLCAYGNDSKEKAKALVEQGGWSFPVYYDTDGDAMTAYAIRSMPTTLFVSADGVLVGKQIGAMSESQLQAKIDALLGE